MYWCAFSTAKISWIRWRTVLVIVEAYRNHVLLICAMTTQIWIFHSASLVFSIRYITVIYFIYYYTYIIFYNIVFIVYYNPIYAIILFCFFKFQTVETDALLLYKYRVVIGGTSGKRVVLREKRGRKYRIKFFF